MHRPIAACLLALSLGTVALPCHATGLSMNEVELRPGATLDECKSLGRMAIKDAGLTAIPESPASVFGATPSNELAVIYCLPQRGIAIVGVAGGDNQVTRPILLKLLGLMTAKR